MNISKFDYKLPKEFIANNPASPRDHSKLLVLNRKTKKIVHKHFYDLPEFLTENDVLVFNKTKVFPARLFGKRKTGGKVEILLLKNLNNSDWEAITKPGLAVDDPIIFNDFSAKVTARKNYITNIHFPLNDRIFFAKLNQIGKTPVPPYIKTQTRETLLRKRYQTVYAKDTGSAAAPTAGLHFTNRLINNLRKNGVETQYVTLHVGLGTFAPVKEKDIKNHKIHSEEYSVSLKTIKQLNEAKDQGKRIIAVGTTTTRVLESLAAGNSRLDNKNVNGSTNLFIYPPYKFRFVDCLITNFHLPKSTLLAFVCAFTTAPNTKEKFINFSVSSMGIAYSQAVGNHYRFFSFGDSMFIV